MVEFYDTEEGEFKSLDPQSTKVRLVQEFFAWIIQRRQELELSVHLLRREVREGIAFASYLPELGESHAQVCFQLAQVESDLSAFDSLYLVAACAETHELLDFSAPSTRLLWEWFCRAQEGDN